VDFVLINIALLLATLAAFLLVIIVIFANAMGVASSGTTHEGWIVIFLLAGLVFLSCLMWRLWGVSGLGLGAAIVWLIGAAIVFAFGREWGLFSRALVAALWPFLLIPQRASASWPLPIFRRSHHDPAHFSTHASRPSGWSARDPENP